MTTRYQNGYVPDSALVTIATGTDSNGPWKHQGSPHIIALWRALQAYAQAKWQKTPKIRTGWNIYRPFAIQVAARQRACALGNCLGAAYQGWSSHGGTWNNKGFTGGVWVDALAIDVDPNGLTWDQVWEAGRAVGFLCGAITTALAGMEEPWHIIDLDPWAPAPADTGGSTPFPSEVDVVTDADRAAIAADVVKALWATTVKRTIDGKDVQVPVLQEIADAKTNAISGPARVWSTVVHRDAGDVPALQELADTKTTVLAIKAAIDAQSTAPAPTIDYDALAAAIVRQGGQAPTPEAIAAAVRAEFTSNPLK